MHGQAMALMALSLLLQLFFFIALTSSSPAHVADPDEVAQAVVRSIRNSSSRSSSLMMLDISGDTCKGLLTGNPVDDCWRCDPNWEKNRWKLADCGIGFGRDAIGGRDGEIYVVTDPHNDDPTHPTPGTLRYGVIQKEPLWIIFAGDMKITLKEELMVSAYKTLDGRGSNVHITGGPCITIQYESHVIIHGLSIHDCKSGGNAYVIVSPEKYSWRTISDGDGVSIFDSTHIWVDHNSIWSCRDGLVDAIHGSTAITISNNYFAYHNKVMLLGHDDGFKADKNMQVTIAFNHFGEGLVQRMPR